MKYFFDTEFIEDGKTIDLISIGIVCEDNTNYYAISTDFNPCKASDWVVKNVLEKLPPAPAESQIFATTGFPNLLSKNKYWAPESINLSDPSESPSRKQEALKWKSRETIALEVTRFVKGKCIYDNNWEEREECPIFSSKETLWEAKLDIEPKFWAYYADYDWVVFCQLFGSMMDLPKGFPMYCKDIKQELDRLGIVPEPQKNGEHNALEDAKYNKFLYDTYIGVKNE